MDLISPKATHTLRDDGDACADRDQRQDSVHPIRFLSHPRHKTCTCTQTNNLKMKAAGVDYPRDLQAIQTSTAQEVADNWSSIAIPNREPR